MKYTTTVLLIILQISLAAAQNSYFITFHNPDNERCTYISEDSNHNLLLLFFPTLANTAGGTIGFSAIGGGIGAELTGGNFWEGAATGAIVGSLNHMQHRVETIKSGIAQLRNRISQHGNK